MAVKRLRRTFRLAVVAAYLVLGVASAAVVPDRVEVTADEILLGDLLVGLEGAVAGARVGYAPYPGHHRWVSKSEITGAMGRAGLDPSGWSIPERVLITRQSHAVASSQVREAIEVFLGELYPDFRIEIEKIEMPIEVVLPAGEVEIQVNDGKPPTHLKGATLKLDFYIAGRLEKSQWARVTGTAFAEVVVVKSDLDYGDLLTASTVSLEEREIESFDAYFDSLESVVGSVARKKLASGDILLARDTREAVMVKRGDVVTLVANGASYSISTAARSRDNGARGDSITVMNLDSKQLVEARVVGAGVVEALASGRVR